MTIYIDPGQGALSQAIEKLGTGIAMGVTEKARRLEALRQNPQAMAGIAAAFRRAGTPQNQAALAQSLGLNLSDIQTLASGLQPDNAERTDIAAGREGLPELIPKAQRGQAEESIATSTANLANNVAGNAAFAKVQTDILAGRSAEEALRNNIPMLSAVRDATGLQFDTERFNYEGELLRYRRENGVDLTEIDFKNLGNQIGAQAAGEYDAWFNSLPQGSRERTEAAMALTSPQYLNYTLAKRRLNFEESLALARASQGEDPGDRIDRTLRLNTAWQGVVDRAIEAQENGTPQQRATAARNLESVRLMIEEGNEAGFIYPIDTAAARTSGRKNEIELEQRIFSPDVSEAFKNINVDINQLDSMSDEQVALALQHLPPRTREKFIGELEAYQTQLDSLRPKTRTVLGETISETAKELGGLGLSAVGFTRPVRESAVEWGTEWYNILAPEVKQLLDDLSLPTTPVPR